MNGANIANQKSIGSTSSLAFEYIPVPNSVLSQKRFQLTEDTFLEYVASLYPELTKRGESTNPFKVLGLRQNRSFYPLEIFLLEPSAFATGNFELIISSTSDKNNNSDENNSQQSNYNIDNNFNTFVATKSSPASSSDQNSNSINNNMSVSKENPVEFWLSPGEAYKVSVSYDDVARLKRLSAAAYLVGTTPVDVYSSLNKVAVDGLVDNKQYEQFCQLILNRVGTSDQGFVNKMLKTLFTAFDRTGNALVDLDELSSGFSLMTEGSKSDKLSLAFDVFDADDDGLLSRRELWKFLRAFLSVILEFSDAKSSAGSISNLHNAVDDAAVEMVATIFKDLGVEMTSKISFEDFGEWYNNVGHTQMPWLELLDMNKWPSRSNGQSNGYSNDIASQEEDDDAFDDDDSNALDDSDVSTFSLSPIYEFDLGGSVKLKICSRDVENLNTVLTLTNLHQMTGASIQRAVRDTSEDGKMTKGQFDSLIRGLKPGEDLSKDEKTFLSFAFSSYFFAFDRHGANEVDATDFANGFTLLASGSKSDKLSLAFQMLEQDDEGYVDKRELWQYLRSFLTMIAALTEQMSTAPSGKVSHVIHNACMRTTESIFTSGILQYGDRICFEEFADWYTQEGYTSIPWIELLDLRKWPYETLDQTDDSIDEDLATTENDEEDENTTTASSSVDATPAASASWQTPIFEFDLNTFGDTLTFFPRHVETLRRFVRLSAFGEMDYDDIAYCLKVDNADGTIDGNGFIAAVTAATDLEDLNEIDYVFVSDVLNEIYDAYSVDENTAAVNGLIAGLTVFTKGSKSEKLGHVFDLFCGSSNSEDDDEDRDEINLTELVSFLKGFLIVLATLSDSESLQMDISGSVEVGAIEITNSIFKHFGKGAEDTISFSDFAQWYSEGGYKVAPFLELLDMKKWPGPTFEFVLTKAGETLCIFTQDIDYLGSILTLTKLDTYDTATICGGLEAVSSNGLVSKPGFDEFVRMLIPGNDLSNDDKKFLSYALSKIFFSFSKQDSEGNQICLLDELSCGMLMLASGSKSDKLSVAFQAMGEGDNESLPKRDMWRYLKSFLTALFALTNSAIMNDPSADIGKILHNASVEVTEEMFDQADIEDDDLMRFEEFADWYTYGGFEIVPWLELLDLKKWPNMLLQASAPVSPSGVNNQSKADNLGSTDEDESVATDDFQLPDIEEEASLIFNLGNAGPQLKIYPKDVEKLRLILDLTGMDGMTCAAIQEAFQIANDPDPGYLSKSKFDQTVVSLVSGENLSQEEKKFLSFVLSSIFFAYSNTEDQVADMFEVSSGFTLFAGGSKSEKLALAFQLLDSDGEGYVSNDQLATYLRAFLTVLAALTDHLGTVPSGDALKAIDDACVEVTMSVFSEADLMKDGLISFEEFAEWYTQGGYNTIPWLELLDLKKWPYEEIDDSKYENIEDDLAVEEYDDDEDDYDVDSLNNNPSSTADANSIPIVFDDMSEEKLGYEGEEGDDSAAGSSVFEFVLNSDGDNLILSSDDVENVRRLVRTTGLMEKSFNDVQTCLKRQVVDSTIDRKGYVAALGELLTLETLLPPDREFAIGMLVKLFNAYDAENLMVVSIDNLTAALSVFVSGTKSEKLGYIFEVFDDDKDGSLSQDRLFKFLRSLLSALGSTSSLMSERGVDAARLSYDQTSVELTERIFRETQKEDDLMISFSDFADWYTDGGYRVAPWLELLDMRKWPGPSFDFTLTLDGDKLSIFPTDVNGLADAMSLSKLDEIAPLQMQDVVQSIGYEGDVIEQDDFDYIIRTLVPGDSLTMPDKRFLSSFFSKYFLCMEEFYKFTNGDNDQSITANRFLVGMVLLSEGSKSSKLSFAFNLIAETDDETLSKEELASFFGSLLLSLHSVTESMKKAINAYGLAKVMHGIVNAAAALSATVFDQSDKVDSDRINFEEFADWYTYGGFEVAPWLELLDLKKWQTQQ